MTASWGRYLVFEAARRGVSVATVRDEEKVAQGNLNRIALNRKRLYAAAYRCSELRKELDL